VDPNPFDADNGAKRAADPVEALVDRVLDGDKEAFNQLVRLHEAYMYRICLGITDNVSDAEDAMQNTFLNAFLNLGQFRREARFRSWLTRIAINEALRSLRKREGSAIYLDQPNESDESWMPKEISDWGPNPEQSLLAAELRQVVEDAILALPAPYRVVFVLRDICEHKSDEVAQVLNLSIAAVKSRLLRARLKVREHLSQRFKKQRDLRESLSQMGVVLRGLADRFCRFIGLKR
jgi:RNA polymerase sigma-70 factor (ECF subfamily)